MQLRVLTQIRKRLRDSRSAVLRGVIYNLVKADFPEIHAFYSLIVTKEKEHGKQYYF